jgi:hypothetical protein
MNLLQQNKEILLCVLSSKTACIFARVGTALAPSSCCDHEFITTLLLEHCREPSIAAAARFYRKSCTKHMLLRQELARITGCKPEAVRAT